MQSAIQIRKENNYHINKHLKYLKRICAVRLKTSQSVIKILGFKGLPL